MFQHLPGWNEGITKSIIQNQSVMIRTKKHIYLLKRSLFRCCFFKLLAKIKYLWFSSLAETVTHPLTYIWKISNFNLSQGIGWPGSSILWRFQVSPPDKFHKSALIGPSVTFSLSFYAICY